MLKIALPNKGALSDGALRLVQEAGYHCDRSRRDLAVLDVQNDVEFYFLRPRDIAIYVSNGVLDLGITGRDLMLDSGADVKELLPLNFGKANFCYAVPKEDGRTPDAFNGMRIATSYRNLVREDMAERGVDAEVVHLDGAVEISIKMGVADAVADVVQTGRTLDQAGLAPTGEPILKSEAVLVGRTDEAQAVNGVQLFIERLRGILLGREYVMVEYVVPEPQLDRATEITPGIESPTVAPLSKDGWVAVKAMAREANVNTIMDELSAIGAKGIIITDIRTCRI
ncbi:MAG: ATP phosphoribosyltransferase [Bacteroidetes bacterium]|jgi:ATP phosphoribosyltransferase|nr:ATP phosphoribosyltransferase [Bacteroidota bacterium]